MELCGPRKEMLGGIEDIEREFQARERLKFNCVGRVAVPRTDSGRQGTFYELITRRGRDDELKRLAWSCVLSCQGDDRGVRVGQ